MTPTRTPRPRRYLPRFGLDPPRTSCRGRTTTGAPPARLEPSRSGGRGSARSSSAPSSRLSRRPPSRGCRRCCRRSTRHLAPHCRWRPPHGMGCWRAAIPTTPKGKRNGSPADSYSFASCPVRLRVLPGFSATISLSTGCRRRSTQFVVDDQREKETARSVRDKEKYLYDYCERRNEKPTIPVQKTQCIEKYVYMVLQHSISYIETRNGCL
jgi:hypothetical protein